jgi:DHA1 family tetracycline resistance protein-like MFS transporter
MQLVGAPLLGRLSDRFGRRPVLLLSIFGTFLGFMLLGFATTLWMLFASRIIDGLTGGNLSVAQAYISDVTDPKDRAKGLGLIGAAFGLGFIIGPATGGVLSQWGYAVPAFVAAGLAFINLLLVFFWLPESLTPEKRTLLPEKQPSISMGALLVALQRPFTGSLLITRFFFGFAFVLFQSIFTLYALDRFNLTALQTSLILVYVGVISVVTQGFLIGRITKRFREDMLIGICVIMMAFGLLGWALAPSVLILLIIIAPISFSGGLLNTILTSTLTKAVTTDEVGGIIGFSTSIESLTRVIAPTFGGYLLVTFGAWAPGLFGAMVLGGLSVYVWRTIYNHPIAASLHPGPVRDPQPIID